MFQFQQMHIMKMSRINISKLRIKRKSPFSKQAKGKLRGKIVTICSQLYCFNIYVDFEKYACCVSNNRHSWMIQSFQPTKQSTKTRLCKFEKQTHLDLVFEKTLPSYLQPPHTYPHNNVDAVVRILKLSSTLLQKVQPSKL